MSRTRLFALIAGLALITIEARGANPPGALDQPPSNVLPGAVEMTPQAGPQQRAVEQPLEPTGNPLWGVPISTLTATRERPLFTPSRRAPAPAVAGPVVAAPPAPPAPAPAEPERPQLVLVGAIASGSEGIAVFLDQATNNVIRLRTGQDHSGWVLRSVKGREATLQKDQQTTTLTLPVPGEAPALTAPGMPGVPRGPNDEPL
jgi:general secretion pathway protein N